MTPLPVGRREEILPEAARKRLFPALPRGPGPSWRVLADDAQMPQQIAAATSFEPSGPRAFPVPWALKPVAFGSQAGPETTMRPAIASQGGEGVGYRLRRSLVLARSPNGKAPTAGWFKV